MFITLLGYEARCTDVARRMESCGCRKIALTKPGHLSEFSYAENRLYYQESGYEIIQVMGEVPDVEALIGDFDRDDIRILFDITGMSQRWYYGFPGLVSGRSDEFQSAMLRFTYTAAMYVLRVLRKSETDPGIPCQGKEGQKEEDSPAHGAGT
ncbi:MAG: hypothetical protein R2751_12365 [Bacteroidales bacterium]